MNRDCREKISAHFRSIAGIRAIAGIAAIETIAERRATENVDFAGFAVPGIILAVF